MEDSLPLLISQEELSAELKNAIIARQVSNVLFFFSLHIFSQNKNISFDFYLFIFFFQTEIKKILSKFNKKKKKFNKIISFMGLFKDILLSIIMGRLN